MTLDPGLNRFPETSNDVFNAIVRSMPFSPGRYFGMPLIHRIIWEKPETVRELLTRLKSADSRHPLDIDAINDVGDTALLSVVAHSTRHSVDFRYGTQEMETLKLLPDSPLTGGDFKILEILLDEGAQLDFVSLRGNTVLKAVDPSNHVRRYDHPDWIVAFNMQQLIALESPTRTAQSKLVQDLPISVLSAALYRGRTLTAALLLKHGMKARVGGIFSTYPDWVASDLPEHHDPSLISAMWDYFVKPLREPNHTRHVTDTAFCGAGRTRLFMHSLGRYLGDPESDQASPDARALRVWNRRFPNPSPWDPTVTPHYKRKTLAWLIQYHAPGKDEFETFKKRQRRRSDPGTDKNWLRWMYPPSKEQAGAPLHPRPAACWRR
jgi:hypothetical protein